VYGLGVCAASCGEAFAEIVPAALEKLAAVIRHPQARDEDNEAASDNAVGHGLLSARNGRWLKVMWVRTQVSAVGKICLHFSGQADLASILPMWCVRLRSVGWVVGADTSAGAGWHTCH
jgi:hypothetical protein